MRPSTVDLLRIRDGEPVDASVRASVDRDPGLRAELESLETTRRAMRALPTLAPPPEVWPRLAARLDHEPVARSTASRGWPLRAAIAAGVAVAAVWLAGRAPDVPRAEDGAAPATIVADQLPQRGPLLGTPEYTSLVARSAALERALDGLNERPRVVRVGTAATIAGLENHIGWIDDQLMFARSAGLSAEDTQDLYRQRVELLNALVHVRYAQTRRFGY